MSLKRSAKFCIKSLFSLSFLALGCFSLASVALGEASKVEETNANVPTEQTPSNFISDGQPLQLTDLGIEINPISGWEINKSGMISLIMKEPEVVEDPKNINYDEPRYRRNITVAAIHRSLPVDKARAQALGENLLEKFGKTPGISNYVIGEPQFFDYRSTKDGIVIYADFNYRKFEMRQMHMLVGGENNQFLLTYTDFKKSFESNHPIVAQAWQSMTSIKVTGEPPVRHQALKFYGPIALGTLIVLILLVVIRSNNNKQMLKQVIAEVDMVDGEYQEYQPSTIWNLGTNIQRREQNSFASSKHLPKTQVSFVSNVSHISNHHSLVANKGGDSESVFGGFTRF